MAPAYRQRMRSASGDDIPPRSRSISPYSQIRRDDPLPPARSTTPSPGMEAALRLNTQSINRNTTSAPGAESWSASWRGETKRSGSIDSGSILNKLHVQDGRRKDQERDTTKGLRHSRSFDFLSRFKAPSPVPSDPRPSNNSSSLLVAQKDQQGPSANTLGRKSSWGKKNGSSRLVMESHTGLTPELRQPGWLPSSPLTARGLARDHRSTNNLRAALDIQSSLGVEADLDNKERAFEVHKAPKSPAKGKETIGGGEKKSKGFRSSLFGLFGKQSSNKGDQSSTASSDRRRRGSSALL